MESDDKKQLIDRAIEYALKKSRLLDQAMPLAVQSISREGISYDEISRKCLGVDDAVAKFKSSNPKLFDEKGYMDMSKSLEQHELERDLLNYGRSARGYH